MWLCVGLFNYKSYLYSDGYCVLLKGKSLFLHAKLILKVNLNCLGIGLDCERCGPAASLMADQLTEAVNFTNDFPMVFNSPFTRRENVRADGKVNMTFTH